MPTQEGSNPITVLIRLHAALPACKHVACQTIQAIPPPVRVMASCAHKHGKISTSILFAIRTITLQTHSALRVVPRSVDSYVLNTYSDMGPPKLPTNLATPRPSRPSSPRPDLTITTDTSKLLRKPKTSPSTVSMEDALTPDLLAVHELLSTMKFTLSALGKTFESLGEQTTKVAELGPAMEATDRKSVV